jgi:putative ABC transport system permease protein
MPFTMLGGDLPVQVQAGIVSGNYFEVMGLGAVLGRAIGSADDGPGAEPVMMLTYRYWQSVFGGDPAVLGRTYRMNGRTVTVIGVAAPAPPFPGETDVFVNLVTSPHHLDATMVHGRSHRMTDVFARLAPGATVAQAQAELDRIASRMYGDHPENYDAAAGYAITILPLRDALTSNARRTLILLMAVAALVLVTACANVANLVLTRTLRREREFAVRWALGRARAAAADPAGGGDGAGAARYVRGRGDGVRRAGPAGGFAAVSRRGRARSGSTAACWRSRCWCRWRPRSCSRSCRRCGLRRWRVRR